MLDYKKISPMLVFIFGGSGDLNYRKLNPALFNLFLDGAMPENFRIVGIARSEYKDGKYLSRLKEGIDNFSRRKEANEDWAKFSGHISYLPMDVNEYTEYSKLEQIASETEAQYGVHLNIIFYMAVAPQLVPVIVKNLGKLPICHDRKCTRIVIEKPFGHNLESAKEMNKMLAVFFNEEQIFRIDHYLGKETVQNILALRFANALFEPIWNRNYIDHVQITVSEQLGVENRGNYYETAGALRDMVQNHLLQLLCLITMESPVSFEADEVRNRKVDVLNALQRFKPEDVHKNAVRGQYGRGWIEGKR